MIVITDNVNFTIDVTDLQYDEFQEIVKTVNSLVVGKHPIEQTTGEQVTDYNKPLIYLQQLSKFIYISNQIGLLSEGSGLLGQSEVQQLKVKAVKELRLITECLLKEAKNIIEGRDPGYKEET